MNQHLRQSIIAFIWPGPIAGPIPINLFRLLAPLLVIYIGPIFASALMWFITTFAAIVFFRLLELTEGKIFIENLLKRLPKWAHRGIETRGPWALFIVGIILGVFSYAIFLKLIRYSKRKSEVLLVCLSFVNAFIWTGVFWGSVVELGKRVLE